MHLFGQRQCARMGACTAMLLNVLMRQYGYIEPGRLIRTAHMQSCGFVTHAKVVCSNCSYGHTNPGRSWLYCNCVCHIIFTIHCQWLKKQECHLGGQSSNEICTSCLQRQLVAHPALSGMHQ